MVQPSKRAKQGRNKDVVKEQAFFKVIEYLQLHDDEQTTINNLIDKMTEYLPPDVMPYGFTYMISCLKKHFGDEIVITEPNGKPNVVTFRHTASSIISDFYSIPNNNDLESEKIHIIETAAKLLKSDIKLLKQSCDTYPDSTQISVEEALIFLPNSLQVLLEDLFAGKDSKKKVGSIGQAIIQATRPRVLVSPLQIGLAVQMHYNFGSRFLIDSLHEHGFCSSYSEVQRYEHSAALTRGTDIPNFCANDTIQYMADNVDHNVNTLDGLNTFHGMGMIVTITPG